MRWDTKHAKRVKRKLIKHVPLICDECKKPASQELHEDARRQGWLLTVDGLVLCPVCKKIPLKKSNLSRSLQDYPDLTDLQIGYARSNKCS